MSIEITKIMSTNNKEILIAPYLTVNDVSQYLQMSKGRVYEFINCGEIAAIKVGAMWRIKLSDVDMFLEKNTFAPCIT